MFTPQEIQERSASLEKAVFGGYSMSSVEELLTPLIQDYAALYKENNVLKSKMKVLVDRLEGYRKSEDGINRALLSAQKTADEVVDEAERKCAQMVEETERSLLRRSQELKDQIAAEEKRVEEAKREAAGFISAVERLVQNQITALEALKEMDLSVPAPEPKKPAARLHTAPEPEPEPEPEAEVPAPEPEPEAEVPAPEPETETVRAEDESEDSVAREIEENISRIFAEAAGVARAPEPEDAPAN